jgi:hypothetical protein
VSILAVNGEVTIPSFPIFVEVRVWLWNGLFHVEVFRGSLRFDMLDFVFEKRPITAKPDSTIPPDRTQSGYRTLA